MKRRGKLVAFSTVAVGVVVIVAAGFAAKDRIREEWYLHRLESGVNDSTICMPAAVRLIEMGSFRGIPALLRAEERCTQDANSDLLEAWGYVVVKIADMGPAVIPILSRYIKDHGFHRGGRQSLFCTVGLLAETHEAAFQVLLEGLKDTDPMMRVFAAEQLGFLGAKGEQAIPALSAVLSNDADTGVRVCMALALGSIGAVSGRAALNEALTDPSERVRQAAAEALTKIQSR